MAFPAVLVVLILIGSFFRLLIKCNLSGQAFLESSLPNILRLLFIFYPIVTNTAFEAFSCYTFDENTNYTSAFLVSDVNIACSLPWGPTEQEGHTTVTIVAFAAVVIYPIGLILLNGVLLFSARDAIRSGKSTPLSRATAFLHREYEPAFYWWELVESTRNRGLQPWSVCVASARPAVRVPCVAVVRRVVLVGVMVLVMRGTITQVVIGTVFSLAYLLLQVCLLASASTRRRILSC